MSTWEFALLTIRAVFCFSAANRFPATPPATGVLAVTRLVRQLADSCALRRATYVVVLAELPLLLERQPAAMSRTSMPGAMQLRASDLVSEAVLQGA